MSKFTSIVDIINDVMVQLGFPEPEDWMHLRDHADAAWLACENLGFYISQEDRCPSQPIIKNSLAHKHIQACVETATLREMMLIQQQQ